MPLDPRLGNNLLLMLAAKRAQAKHQTDAATAWEHGAGLASLLEAARHLPPRELWDLPDLERRGSLGKLLAEARALLKEGTDVAG
jgi:hypothetical protein